MVGWERLCEPDDMLEQMGESILVFIVLVDKDAWWLAVTRPTCSSASKAATRLLAEDKGPQGYGSLV